MAGNRNSGRRRSVETLLRDAGMSTRLATVALRRAATEHQAEARRHQEKGRALTDVLSALCDLEGDIDRAVAEMQRHTDPTPPAAVVSIDRRRGERRTAPTPTPQAMAA